MLYLKSIILFFVLLITVFCKKDIDEEVSYRMDDFSVEVFESIDLNNNGRLNLEEFSLYISAMSDSAGTFKSIAEKDKRSNRNVITIEDINVLLNELSESDDLNLYNSIMEGSSSLCDPYTNLDDINSRNLCFNEISKMMVYELGGDDYQVTRKEYVDRIAKKTFDRICGDNDWISFEELSDENQIVKQNTIDLMNNLYNNNNNNNNYNNYNNDKRIGRRMFTCSECDWWDGLTCIGVGGICAGVCAGSAGFGCAACFVGIGYGWCSDLIRCTFECPGTVPVPGWTM
jgi:hypothetical protein